MEYQGNQPIINENAFVAQGAVIIGKVNLANDASVWFNSVLRGDVNEINIGQGTNIQDLTMVHVASDYSCNIGSNVTVGHRCIIHGCTIGDNTLVGMGSIILDGAKIGSNCLVGAGSMVTQGKVFPDNSLILGSPAKFIRQLTEEEILGLEKSAQGYINLSKTYR